MKITFLYQTFSFSEISYTEFGLNFIYDARKDNKLIEPGDSAERAINTLCQFNVLDKAIEDANERFRLAKESGGKGSKSQVTKLSDNIKKYQNQLKKLEQKATDRANQLQELIAKKNNIENILEKNRSQTRNYNEKSKEIKEKIKANQDEIDEVLSNIFTSISMPVQLNNTTSKYLKRFRDCLEVCKLPHESGKEFFKELSQKMNVYVEDPFWKIKKTLSLKIQKDI